MEKKNANWVLKYLHCLKEYALLMLLNSNMQIFELHHEIQFNGQI